MFIVYFAATTTGSSTASSGAAEEYRGKSQMTHEVVGGDVVVSFLETRTADCVFGISGSASVPVFEALAGSARLRHVPSLTEAAAVGMADGYARFAGPAAVLLYMLPGVAVGLGNLYNASRDETPLLILVSQHARQARWGQAAVGEADTATLLAPFARFSRELSSRSLLAAAHRAAIGPPGGLGVAVLPEDCLEGPVPPPTVVTWPSRRPVAASDVGPLADRLLSADRPILVVGGQLRRCGGTAAVTELADRFGLPVFYEPFWNDRLAIDPGHPCAFGPLAEGSSEVRSADFVLAIGTRLFNEVHPRADPWFAPGAYIGHVNADCQKVEINQGTQWSCAADPALFTRQLLDACLARAGRPHARPTETELGERREQARLVRGPFAAVASVLADSLDHGYLVDESVSGSHTLVTALTGRHGERYVSTTGGSLGWGVPAACGVALATGEPVTSVLGDGAFFFGAQGLWTAAALRLPVTFVVLDNGGYGSTQWYARQYAARRNARATSGGLGDASPFELSFAGSSFGADGPSVASVASGYGVQSVQLESVDELANALAASRGVAPAVVRVPVLSLAGRGGTGQARPGRKLSDTLTCDGDSPA
jgi:thiamine pyrophosphate-dependent acetolactate synthase large subunit-like protein